MWPFNLFHGLRKRNARGLFENPFFRPVIIEAQFACAVALGISHVLDESDVS